MGLLDVLEPVYKALPVVRPPETEPPLKKKLLWSGIVLLLFFIMGRIELIGLTAAASEYLEGLQVILASEIGTLITAGITPIVMSSIILQLLVGGKLISIDLTDPADRAKFQGLQKLFAIILCVFEGFIYPLSGLVTPAPGMLFLLVFQITLGSIIIIYLDEVISKYGVGSGIGLFIAGGVSAGFLWQALMPPGVTIAQPAGGLIPQFITSFSTGVNFLIIFPILMAILLFLIVAYANAIHVNIPITMGRKGTGGRFPVKFLYVSVMPVILTVALFANIRIWALVGSNIPVLGSVLKGIEWATNTPFNLFPKIAVQAANVGLIEGITSMMPDIIQGIVYLIVFVVLCVVFGKFWVAMGGQGPEDVARQLQASGMYIPGFRRDERIIVKILGRYIPPITILGSIFVGLLAGIGNMALGGLISGTGILLTVDIVYRLYEELARQQLLDMHPMLGKILG